MSQAPEEPDSEAAAGYLAAFDRVFRLHEQGMSFSGRERNCAFLNLGDGDFANLSAGSGLDFPEATAARPDLQFRWQPLGSVVARIVPHLMSKMREARDGSART